MLGSTPRAVCLSVGASQVGGPGRRAPPTTPPDRYDSSSRDRPIVSSLDRVGVQEAGQVAAVGVPVLAVEAGRINLQTRRAGLVDGEEFVPQLLSVRSAVEPAEPGSCGWLLALQWPHIGGLGAFLALGDVELDGLALIK